MFDETGLVPISAHVSINDFRADLEGTLAKYSEIGQQFIGTLAPTENRPDTKILRGTDEIAEIGKAAKIRHTLLYHNHDFEFVKIDGKSTVLTTCMKKSPRTCSRRNSIPAG